MEDQEAKELAEHDNLVRPIDESDSLSQIEAWAQDYADARAAREELLRVNQYLMHAITCLPGKQLKISLTEQAQLAEQPFKLQAKRDDKGTLYFRAVKTFG